MEDICCKTPLYSPFPNARIYGTWKREEKFEENAVASKMNNFYGSLVFQATLSKLSAPKRHDSTAGRTLQQHRIKKSWLCVWYKPLYRMWKCYLLELEDWTIACFHGWKVLPPLLLLLLLYKFTAMYCFGHDWMAVYHLIRTIVLPLSILILVHIILWNNVTEQRLRPQKLQILIWAIRILYRIRNSQAKAKRNYNTIQRKYISNTKIPDSRVQNYWTENKPCYKTDKVQILILHICCCCCCHRVVKVYSS